ncbi:MAG TPA: TlpA family protein disulfide reductase [Candidatus Coprenecus stercoravium]|uniref:TlpA family protein disulfide reductase n=1 Tax=Candidatus Coprenecus stercoravium TaxID=2840735 RepID=A0A9D2GS63_9BACT|nr:TlpA family protein disulfide reductase [Candidatus Coprenecus stercoravium]
MTRCFLILLSACLTLASCVRSGSQDKIKAGDNLPEFTLSSEVNGELSSAELKGKVTYLCFFATWCPPCQQKMAALRDTLYPMFENEEDFRLVAVGREHTDADLMEFDSTGKFPFPLYPDPERKVYSLFATGTIPRAYLIGRDGVVVDAETGFDRQHLAVVMDTIRELLNSIK